MKSTGGRELAFVRRLAITAFAGSIAASPFSAVAAIVTSDSGQTIGLDQAATATSTTERPLSPKVEAELIRSIQKSRKPSQIFEALCFRTDAELGRVQRLAAHFGWAPYQWARQNSTIEQQAWLARINGFTLVIEAAHTRLGIAGVQRIVSNCLVSDVYSTEPDFLRNVTLLPGLKNVDAAHVVFPAVPADALVASKSGQDDGSLTVQAQKNGMRPIAMARTYR